jgi:DNA invertase Pin-like site-specific DNA recombinase
VLRSAPERTLLWPSRNSRLSRSFRDVLTIMERLAEAKTGFRSLTEEIDTTTAAGRMMMQIVGAFAEFERAMLSERTEAGLEAAPHEGRIRGRRPKLTPRQRAEISKYVIGLAGLRRAPERLLMRSKRSNRCLRLSPKNPPIAPRRSECAANYTFKRGEQNWPRRLFAKLSI